LSHRPRLRQARGAHTRLLCRSHCCWPAAISSGRYSKCMVS
jgi:hypothetical protein